MQGLLCGVLQVIIQKLSDQDSSKAAVTQYADSIMEALISVMACHSSTIHEEAMLAIGALTYACGPQFSKYLDKFYPYLQRGLTNYKVGHMLLLGSLSEHLISAYCCRAVDCEVLHKQGCGSAQACICLCRSGRYVKPQWAFWEMSAEP